MKNKDHRCHQCGAWLNQSRECEPCDSNSIYRIVERLKADPRRDIYEAGSRPHDFWITYQGGGPIPRATVIEMLERGMLNRKYPTGECYVLSSNDPSSPTAAGRDGEAERKRE